MNSNVVVRILFCSNIGSDSLLGNVAFAYISVRAGTSKTIAAVVRSSLVFFSFTQKTALAILQMSFLLIYLLELEYAKEVTMSVCEPAVKDKNLNVVEE